AIDAACQSLDAVPAQVAQALLSSTRGLARGVTEDEAPQALAAHTRLVEHLARAATSREVDPALGGRALAALLGAVEALDVDLGMLADEVAAERARLHAMLEEACGRILPGLGVREAVVALQDDHPAAADMISEAQA